MQKLNIGCNVQRIERVCGIQEVLKQFLVNGRPVRMGPESKSIGRFSRIDILT
jgi:hypothetical protein